MPRTADQLVVRQHERFHCRVPVQLRVEQDMTDQVALARTVGDGSGAVDAFITDTSRGGLGVESKVFFPRGCRIRIRVHGSGTDTGLKDELIVRVQRATMLDRSPTYYLGLSFLGKEPEHDHRIGELLALVQRSQPATPSQTPGPQGAPLVPGPIHDPGKGGG